MKPTLLLLPFVTTLAFTDPFEPPPLDLSKLPKSPLSCNLESLDLIEPRASPPIDAFKLRKGLLRCDFNKWMGARGYYIWDEIECSSSPTTGGTWLMMPSRPR
ncbi:hypothetical protein CDD80_2392 [Ophiocordyceps camponoti-rufipedis]|uniref:Uncharacterized protein n=1 Tax=Ophiocordyceps camponoti-rufipedis TaxID=2004952 RepID=A0A2C5XSG7_9HYPO|nr:hypothetical protein CDD80_2392 [Ophiocordyceps camponoti-rufipedis]